MTLANPRRTFDAMVGEIVEILNASLTLLLQSLTSNVGSATLLWDNQLFSQCLSTRLHNKDFCFWDNEDHCRPQENGGDTVSRGDRRS